MNSLQILGTLELGLIYGLVAIGVFLTFRVIKFSDMTVDGSFTLGGAIATVLILNGINPILATLAAICAGAFAGAITAYLSIKLNILDLLASIIIMMALYSLNLRIMGSPNLALLTESTLFGEPGCSKYTIITIISFIVLIISFSLNWFLATEFGLGMKAIGINRTFSRAYGINVSFITILGVALSNALVALSGALFAQSKEYADISMGTGTIIIGLASVFIGETLFRNSSTALAIISCLIGAILYRVAITLALNAGFLGLQSSDINLVSSLLVIAALAFSHYKNQMLKPRPTRMHGIQQ